MSVLSAQDGRVKLRRYPLWLNGRERITPHKLRHPVVSTLVKAGRSIDEIKELRGFRTAQRAGLAARSYYLQVEREKRAVTRVAGSRGVHTP